jgi:hypothetical protein
MQASIDEKRAPGQVGFLLRLLRPVHSDLLASFNLRIVFSLGAESAREKQTVYRKFERGKYSKKSAFKSLLAFLTKEKWKFYRKATDSTV